MLKKSLTASLAFLLLNLSFGNYVSAQTQNDKDAQREREAQIYVNKIGVSDNIPIVVKLMDGRKSVKGHISQIDDETFAITDKKKKTTTTLKYSEVRSVSRDRTSNWLMAGIVVGALVGAALICVASGKCQD